MRTALGTLVLAWLVAAPVAAQDEAARIHHDAAQRFYELGDFERAIEEWNQAYALSGRDELLFNLFTAHERAGNVAEAASHLERFLASGVAIENRAQLESRLAVLRQRLARANASSGPSGLLVGGAVSLGVGGAAAVLMAVFGGLAASEYGSLDGACPAPCPDERTSDLRTFNTVADVSLAVALVAGVAGVVLLVIDAAQPTEVAIGPTGASVRGRF